MGKGLGRAIEPMAIGQNPNRKIEIETQLFEDFKPKDILEEIWLSDIAVLTVAIEYYRTLEAAIILQAAKRHGLEDKLSKEFLGREQPPFEELSQTESFLATLCEFNYSDLTQISTIADLISKTRRERERVYLLFERKRRPALLHAMKVAEAASVESYAVERLRD